MPPTTPLRMCSTRGAWTGNSEVAATRISRSPAAAISARTALSTPSPLRRWWWNETVAPSFRPQASIAARRPGSTLLPSGRGPCSRTGARTVSRGEANALANGRTGP